ncbi:alpha/beta-hydrolase, partial [Lindgomyces ingoldianus]
PAHQNTIRWVDCSKNVPESSSTFNASTIDLTSLPPNLHCGRLDVPMDYSKPFCDGNKITLGLAMVRPANPKGALFFNPGGSDAGVVVAWDVALNLTHAFDGLEDFDLLVLDVRGTFSSNPLNVSLETFAGMSGPFPTNQTEFDIAKNASATIIQSWIDNSSPPGIVEHVGTREVVQDYESVRRALGYDRINFLGGSQGGHRAAQYAVAFPDRVGNFVLDSAAPHGLPIYDQAQDQVLGMNRLMLRADAYCQNNASCPFHSQGKGSVPKAFHQIIETAKQSPYFIPACANSTTCSPYITDLDIRNGMLAALIVSPDFPVILEAINSTLAGDASAFVSPPLTLGGVVAIPLLCNDYNDGLKVRQSHTHDERSHFRLQLAYSHKLYCSAWPFEVPKQEPTTTNQSMLMVTADFDGSTPIEWATFSWNTAPKSVLVVRHGDGHVSFPLTDQPSTKITKDFLNTGILPSAQNSTQVTVYTPGMKFAGISDPYDVPTGPEAGD